MANGDSTAVVQVNGTATVTGKSFSFTNTLNQTGIADIAPRQILVPTSVITAHTFGTVAAGQQVSTKGIYIRNTDTTNYVTVGIIKSSAKGIYFKLPAGAVFILPSELIDSNTDGGAVGTLAAATSITLQANTLPVTCEILALN